MIKTKHLFAIFIPAILLVLLIFFVRVIQYEPLFPSDEEYEKIKPQQDFQIPIYTEDPIIGNKKAAINIIAFEDFGCEGCKTQISLLEQIMEKYPGKIKIIWKGLPVTRFPYESNLAHEYAYCINQQNKFSEFYPIAFANNDNLSEEILNLITKEIDVETKKLNECLQSNLAKAHIQKIEQLSLMLNIQSVPTIFINNKQIDPPQIIEGWETLLGL